MQKLFYLMFDDANSDGTKLREQLCDVAAPAIRAAGGVEIIVFGADADVESGNPVRRHDPPIRAMVSFWLNDAADRALCEEGLAALVDGIAGYLVVESRPMAHARTKGQRTEGMKQITCITKRPDLSEGEFIEIWQNDHRAVAIETQSTFGYVRNEIVRPLTPAAPEGWSAFVEESFPIEALEDPMVFFDARTQDQYESNLKRMMQSCQRFLDLDAIEVTFVSEYYLG